VAADPASPDDERRRSPRRDQQRRADTGDSTSTVANLPPPIGSLRRTSTRNGFPGWPVRTRPPLSRGANSLRPARNEQVVGGRDRTRRHATGHAGWRGGHRGNLHPDRRGGDVRKQRAAVDVLRETTGRPTGRVDAARRRVVHRSRRPRGRGTPVSGGGRLPPGQSLGRSFCTFTRTRVRTDAPAGTARASRRETRSATVASSSPARDGFGQSVTNEPGTVSTGAGSDHCDCVHGRCRETPAETPLPPGRIVTARPNRSNHYDRSDLARAPAGRDASRLSGGGPNSYRTPVLTTEGFARVRVPERGSRFTTGRGAPPCRGT
jgi:hypothetical protein